MILAGPTWTDPEAVACPRVPRQTLQNKAFQTLQDAVGWWGSGALESLAHRVAISPPERGLSPAAVIRAN
jgi:hypothetical protein